MPEPIPVELNPHSPAWAEAAAKEIRRLAPALGENLITVHHIGSTAIPGISAKPILDLLPVVRDLAALDVSRQAVESLGYEWWGEFGLPGRRYCTFTDPASGLRKVQLHCYEETAGGILRHLAFRDYLIARPDLAHEYDQLKARCRDLHPQDTHAYTDCKHDWITQLEEESIAFYQSHLQKF